MTIHSRVLDLIKEIRKYLYNRYILQMGTTHPVVQTKIESELVRRTREALVANIKPQVPTTVSLVENITKESVSNSKLVIASIVQDIAQEKANTLNKMLTELFKNLKASPELDFGFFKAHSIRMSIPIMDCLGNIYKGVTSMKMNNLQGVLAGKIVLTTDSGQIVPIEGRPTWSCDNTDIINMLVDVDGLSAKLESTGRVGSANITVTANGLVSQISIQIEDVMPSPGPIPSPVEPKLVATVISVPVSDPYMIAAGSPTTATVMAGSVTPTTFNPDGSVVK